MSTITVALDDSHITLPAFVGFPVESFSSYLTNHVGPALRVALPNMFISRCAITGFPVSIYIDSEIDAMLVNTAAGLGLFVDTGLDTPRDEFVVSSVQAIVEDLEVRLVMLSKKSPLLTFQRDRVSFGHLDRPRQLAILLNMLLWDAGMFRDKFIGVEDHYSKLKRTFATTDHIIAAWNESESFSDLHAALVELDAKYAIRKLMFTRKEMDMLKSFRESDVLDVAGLTAFALRLTAHRDINLDPDLTQDRWTQHVYHQNMLSAASQEAKSNILNKLTSNEVKKATGLKVPTAAVKKVSEKRAATDSAIDALFAGFKL